ncbi:hypothetical protein [Paenibacillus xylanexedens]|uniref:hypothetical protein n=1 Tax=Paenibacillus xylanexedens TaxID=528191 RepID=UPI0011A9CECF|nr:hypothetical protein [Paenibacillus xylanexedens]
MNGDGIGKVGEVMEVGEKVDVQVGELGVGWILREKNVCSGVAGGSGGEEVKENVIGCGVKVDVWMVEEIEEILG